MEPDRFWLQAAAFVRELGLRPDEIVAPNGFQSLVPSISYPQSYNHNVPKAVVFHKGLLHELSFDWITQVTTKLYPVFANEVFVIYSDKMRPKAYLESFLGSPHLRAFHQKLAELKKMTTRSEIPISNDKYRPAVYVGGHVVLTKTIYGHKMYLDTRDVSLAPHILLDGYWEEWITNVFRTLIKPGMCVFDIGANVGWYSLIAANLIGPAGKLISFEANPKIADLLYRNIEINGFQQRAIVEPKAVFDTSGHIELKLYQKHLGSSSIFGSAESAAFFHDIVETVSVEAVALDDYVAPGKKVDFLKIDAEGAEPFILRGARRVLSENHDIQIILEWAPTILVRVLRDVSIFLLELKELGFQIWRINEDSTISKSEFDDIMNAPHCDILLKRS